MEDLFNTLLQNIQNFTNNIFQLETNVTNLSNSFKPQEKKINNETIGQTAEYCVCLVSGIDCFIDKSRIDEEIANSINPVIQKFLNLYPNMKISKSLGYKNGKVDFELENGKTLSLKTLKKSDGKICPQGGQPTLKSWDSQWKLDFNGLVENNSNRFNFIKDHIHEYLDLMLKNTFCCDYLVLISNCQTKPEIEILEKCSNYFLGKDIIFTRDTYEEKWNEKKQKKSEFSTTVKTLIDGKYISVGEFQFHLSSRKELKFRFCKSFLKLIVK